MFDFLKRKPVPQQQPLSLQMREFMFGDVPWARWCKLGAPEVEPWLSFKRARSELDRGDTPAAASTLHTVLATPSYETRFYLQAWHYLRELGCSPTDGKHLFGVIVEVGFEKGLDVLGAYEDRTARYWNFCGAGVVWDRPDDSVDREIDCLFESSRPVVAQIGPWKDSRLAPPETGMVRLSFLTPSGVHFGQGPFNVFSKDSMAGPVIQRATALMQKLISKQKPPS